MVAAVKAQGCTDVLAMIGLDDKFLEMDTVHCNTGLACTYYWSSCSVIYVSLYPPILHKSSLVNTVV